MEDAVQNESPTISGLSFENFPEGGKYQHGNTNQFLQKTEIISYI
jgi:hypothetical protein